MKSKKKEETSKVDEAIGLLWGASLFTGILAAALIGFQGNLSSDWIFASIVGLCTFLILGLTLQAILELKSKK
jgi:hypothetical protein